MMAPEGEDDPRRGKQDISHRDRKDLAILNFSRSTSALSDGDLNFRPRLMTAQEVRTIRAAAKRYSHRDRKDHKDLAGLNFGRSTVNVRLTPSGGEASSLVKWAE